VIERAYCRASTESLISSFVKKIMLMTYSGVVLINVLLHAFAYSELGFKGR
jgi:hypothetical protein